MLKFFGNGSVSFIVCYSVFSTQSAGFSDSKFRMSFDLQQYSDANPITVHFVYFFRFSIGQHFEQPVLLSKPHSQVVLQINCKLDNLSLNFKVYQGFFANNAFSFHPL